MCKLHIPGIVCLNRTVFGTEHQLESINRLNQSVFQNYLLLTGIRKLAPLFGSYGGGYPARMNISYWTPPINIKPILAHHRNRLIYSNK